MIKSILLFVITFFVSSTSGFSQELGGQKPTRNIPVIVSNSFANKFPGKDPVWFSNYQGKYNQELVYEGRFVFDNRYSSAIYDIEGNLVGFTAKVENKEIPEKAMQYMKENFPSFPILDAILVTRNKEDVTYELGIMVDKQYVIKIFSEKGEFMRSTRA